MYQRLIDYINNHLVNELSEKDIEIVKASFEFKKIRKHQFLLQEGEVCKKAAFILKGAMKKYTIDDAGKENIIELFVENWWAGDRESMFTNTPTPYFIDAIEPTEMLVLSKGDMEEQLNQRPFMKELSQALLERHAYQLMRRVQSSKTFTAEQKIVELKKNYPEFLQRFPQHLLASYLGMTKETFSRTRKKIAQK